jgi:hypothetical protein
MEDIVIAKTAKTPAVHFNFNENHLEIAGISIPEDADHFYTPLLEWVNEYISLKKDQATTFALKLIYFNTSTSDYLVSMLKNLKALKVNDLAENIVKKEEEAVTDASTEETVSDEIKSESEYAPKEDTVEEVAVSAHPLRIEWHYEEEDEDMKETGTHFESIIELPFVYIAVAEIE